MKDLTKDISNSLTDLITLLNRKFFDPHMPLRKLHIPHSHIRVLFYLKKNGSTSISQVAQELDILRSNMTPILDKLIADDLVKRHTDPSDRRVIKVEITDKANDIFHSHMKHLKKITADKISSLSEEDTLIFYELILKMIPIIKKLD